MKFDSLMLNRLRDTINIVDIISEHIVLKKRGSELIGICPFHSEKTPSFTVNPEKKCYFCFGCSAKGDAIQFLMELQKLSFIEVIQNLSDRYNISLEGENDQDNQEWLANQRQKKLLIKINEIATNIFHQELLKSKEATSYLAERKIAPETINQFRLGLANKFSNTTISLEVQKLKIDLSLLVEVGLSKIQDGKTFPAFRDRIMIPLFDERGQTLGFSGRSYLSNQQPKYLNTKQTLVFDKSKIIYPFHLASTSIAKSNQVIVVEGNFDVIRLHQEGINNAIATLGTTFSDYQFRRISHISQGNIILAFDNDIAGLKATNKIIKDRAVAIGTNLIDLRVFEYPFGIKDADDLINQTDKEKILNLFKDNTNSLFWIDWKIRLILSKLNLNKGDDFGKIYRLFLEILNQVYDPVTQEFYIQSCGKILAQGNNEKLLDYSKQLRKDIRRPKIQQKNISVGNNFNDLNRNPIYSNNRTKAEFLITKIALFHPDSRQQIKDLYAIRKYSVIEHPLFLFILSQLPVDTLDDDKDKYTISSLYVELKNACVDAAKWEKYFKIDFAKNHLETNELIENLFRKNELDEIAIENSSEKLKKCFNAIDKIKIQTIITEKTEYLTKIAQVEKSDLHRDEVVTLLQELEQLNRIKIQVDQGGTLTFG